MPFKHENAAFITIEIANFYVKNTRLSDAVPAFFALILTISFCNTTRRIQTQLVLGNS